MAKIRIRYGQNEIEIESKDFYIDNQSADEIINNLSVYVKDQSVNTIQYDYSHSQPTPGNDVLNMLTDAEVHEPEFVKPAFLDKRQIKAKIRTLAEDGFFDQSRTVSEVVAQLHEYGWAAVPLDVSKVLTDMAFSNELQKDLREKRSYYSIAKMIELN
ncbi:MAG: hypothetical protein KGI25_07180 [Thaumarchaeota archaeon]|nr:hypothetical protein [Nitrososphaerota archaeon]